MLIDASHPEETRVVVTKGNRVEEFDFESASRKQLRGNIYLAKVTRVEPSLQAAFVDFGGNRHGFLAFSEIHPDYYQIPMADRQALLDEEARATSDDEAEGESEERRGGNRRSNRRRRGRPERARRTTTDTISEDAPADAAGAEGETQPADVEAVEGADAVVESEAAGETVFAAAEVVVEEIAPAVDGDDEDGDQDDHADKDDKDDHPEEVIEQIGGADALEEVPQRAYRPRKQYKIQEVIKRRQILLVQVVKEERGNKGAALTTYLSLAGRYSVLMPNTARGGGISRKITDSVDRKRLKSIAQELEVPDGMGVILRTAGAARTKVEVKRDFEYLMRLWESVRELTLQSTAPALVYEEGSLVKRAIRDLYTKDVEEVLVSGDEGYREAKDFMKMLMPSHAKMVKQYREPQPLFARYGVEVQLDAMFHNIVQLRSGGYIVINQTEALVSIDVNSGRATREHNIEDTALKTNLEAAEEVARQLRLRDLAGLIVIDFIDMEEKRNNRAVERKINDCLKNDRARIQLGRISHFGLLEMSRQRIRTGVLESSTSPCPHCAGTGLKRATSSIALNLVRALEESLLKNAAYDLIVRTPSEIALYVLNHKRQILSALESRFGVTITIRIDETILAPQYHAFERGELSTRPAEVRPTVTTTSIAPEEVEEAVVEETTEVDVDEVSTGQDAGEEGNGRRRRRRRRRRGGRGGEGEAFNADAQDSRDDGEEAAAAADDQADGVGPNAEAGAEDEAATENVAGEDNDKPKRRRRRRGGRRTRRDGEEGAEAIEGDEDSAAEPVEVTRIPITTPEMRDTTEASHAHDVTEALPDVSVTKPLIVEGDEGPLPVAEPAPEPVIEEEPEDPNRPKRSGWWSRARKALGS